MQLRDAFRLASSSGRARRWLTGTTELADGVLAVLNDWQIAILAAGPMRQGAMGQDRRPVGDAAAALLKLKAVPPDQWPQYRKETAERFAGAAGDEEVAPAVSDFLERVRGMSETEMRSKASELAAELQSLVPEGIQALALLA
ncbi:MAG: hypothetical protein H5T86_08920, partial [Armatimonadetes bacterium]|nr:hypothetical protein [Armatimonadota bacterium]